MVIITITLCVTGLPLPVYLSRLKPEMVNIDTLGGVAQMGRMDFSGDIV